MAFFNKEDTEKFISSKDYRVCPRCGEPLKATSRYCLKCGALNYDHPDNQYMKKYLSDKKMKKINKEKYEDTIEHTIEDVYVGGKKLETVDLKDDENEVITIKSNPYKSSLAYVCILSAVTIILSYFLLNRDIEIGLTYGVLTYISWLFIITPCNIYRKANYSGFTTFIPFYNGYAIYDMIYGNGWYFLLMLIPIVNIVFLFITMYKLGRAFGMNGLLTMLLAPIMLPYIAFSDKVAFQNNPVSDSKKKVTRVIGIIFLGIIFIGVISGVWQNQQSKMNYSDLITKMEAGEVQKIEISSKKTTQ